MAELPKDLIPMVEFGFSVERREIMKKVIFLLVLGVVFFPAMICSAGEGQHVIIREGYIVPDGKMLLIDEITIQCTLTPPGQVDSISIPTFNALLQISTPDAAKCRESLMDGVCPIQAYSIGTGTSEETLYGFGGCDGYCPFELDVGRRTNLVAYGGDKLEGKCRLGYDPAIDGPDLYLTSRIVTGMGRLVNASKR
ncbi:MAG: hypothetical protein JRE56_00635 [Deltaproteobacteria bacterium]|jgi:hypothetical protein|nr:hypothetical protein [Deltaproteobacteria bacterium]